MKLLLKARNFTDPTLDTLRDYSLSKFRKLTKLVPETYNIQPQLKVNAEFNQHREVFELKIIFTFRSKVFVFTVDDKDLRRAIDTAENNIRRQILSFRGRHVDYLGI